jgi:hypothetical protein
MHFARYLWAKINFWLVNFKGIVYVSYILEILFHKQGLECDIILMSFDGDTSVKAREVDSL